MLNTFRVISQLSKRIKTLENISLLIFFLLINLMGSNNLLSTRPIKKTRAQVSIKKVFGTIVVANKNLLQLTLI